MARKSRITGISTKSLLRMTESKFGGYSLSEQKQLLSKLVSTANKRIRSFERVGMTSPALYGAGGVDRFSVKGLTSESATLKELTRLRTFLKNPMSSLKTFRKIESKTQESLKQRGIDISKSDVSTLVNLLSQLEREKPLTTAEKYRVFSEASKELRTDPDIDSELLLRNIQDRLDQIYRETQEGFGYDSISDYWSDDI